MFVSELWFVEYPRQKVLFFSGTLESSTSNVGLGQLIEASLWGNKCDLSLSAGEENSQKVDIFSQLDLLRPNIVHNDVAVLVEYILSKKRLQVGKHSYSPYKNLDWFLDGSGLCAKFNLMHNNSN